MTKALMTTGLFALTAALAGCTESAARKERYAVSYDDRPAEIVCRTMGAPFLAMRTSGRIVWDDTTGRTTFLDATSGRLIVTEGECTIAYALDGGRITPPLTWLQGSAEAPRAPAPTVATPTLKKRADG